MKTSYVAVIFLVLKYIPYIEGAIKCFKCQIAEPYYYTNGTILLCKDFDYSEKFIVDCPFSTFCRKSTSSAKIPVPINGTERDCAYQKYESHKLSNGRWHPEVDILELFQDGCHTVDSKGLRTSSIENCYCKGDLCNGATPVRMTNVLLMCITSVILVVFCS